MRIDSEQRCKGQTYTGQWVSARILFFLRFPANICGDLWVSEKICTYPRKTKTSAKICIKLRFWLGLSPFNVFFHFPGWLGDMSSHSWCCWRVSWLHTCTERHLQISLPRLHRIPRTDHYHWRDLCTDSAKTPLGPLGLHSQFPKNFLASPRWDHDIN